MFATSTFFAFCVVLALFFWVLQKANRSKTIFKALFDESQDALFLIQNQSFLLIDCNKRAVEIFQANNKADLMGAQRHLLEQNLLPDHAWNEIKADVDTKGACSQEVEFLTFSGTKFSGKRIVTSIAIGDQVMYLVRVSNISESKHIAEELRSLNNRLQYLLNYTPVVIFSCKPEEDYGATWISDNVKDLLGYEPDDFLHDSSFWSSHIHPDDHDRIFANVQQIFTAGSHTHEYRFLTRDGDYRWVYNHAHLTRDAAGKPAEIIGYLVDINERKIIELALQESESRLQALAANLPGMMYRYHPGKAETGAFTYVGSGAYELFELEPEQILQDVNSLWSLIHPDDFVSLQSSVAVAIQNCANWQCEWRLTTPSGKLKWVQGQSRPEMTPDGVVWDGLMIDITERKLATLALQESEERFREIVNTIPQMFLVRSLNPDRYDYVSPAYERIWGRPVDELMQNPWVWMESIHPEDRDRVQNSLNLQMHGADNRIRREYRIIRPDGEIRWVSVEIAVIRDENGNPLRFIGLTDDVTELKDKEFALAQETLRREMLFNTSIDGIVILDQAGYIIEANASFSGMLGYPVGDTTTLNLADFDALFASKILDGKSWLFNSFINQFETQYRRKDGSFFHVEISTSSAEWNGQQVQFCICRDISERKRKEEERIRIEAALRHSETTNRAMLAAIPDLLLRLKQDGICLDFIPPKSSEAGMFIPIKQNISEILPPDLLKHQLERMKEAVTTGELQIWEHQFLKNGKLCVEEVRVSPCGAEEVLVIARDISDRKRAEETLRRYEQIVSITTDAILLIDRNYVYQVVNQAYANLYNKRKDEIIGRTVSEIASPEIFEAIKPKFEQCLTGETVQYEMWINYPAIGPQFLSLTYDPCFDENRTVSGVVVSLRNITKLKQVEAELELQSVIVRSMAEGVCMIKAVDGTIAYANPKFEQMFGYDAGELKEKHCEILSCYKDSFPINVFQKTGLDNLQYGETTFVTHNVRKDGTPFWCRGTTSIFQQPIYGVVIIAVYQDITEQRLAEAQVKTSLKEKEVLLKEIHHRVRNNLGVVDGLLKMQSRRSSNSEVVETLRESQNRIASIALVHEKLYRSDDLANVDFAQYISDLTSHLFDCYNIYSNRVKLITDIDAIALDIDTIIPCGLIINELVSNALKYAFINAQEGEIHVTFHREQDRTLTLVIKDNGIGLPENFNLKKAKTLGLSLVNGLVKQLQGSLSVETNPGTTFTISLPRA